jgi:hypothetical protein
MVQGVAGAVVHTKVMVFPTPPAVFAAMICARRSPAFPGPSPAPVAEPPAVGAKSVNTVTGKLVAAARFDTIRIESDKRRSLGIERRQGRLRPALVMLRKCGFLGIVSELQRP